MKNMNLENSGLANVEMARVLWHISSFIAARCLSFLGHFLFNAFKLGKEIGKGEKEIGKGQKLIKIHGFFGLHRHQPIQ